MALAGLLDLLLQGTAVSGSTNPARTQVESETISLAIYHEVRENKHTPTKWIKTTHTENKLPCPCSCSVPHSWELTLLWPHPPLQRVPPGRQARGHQALSGNRTAPASAPAGFHMLLSAQPGVPANTARQVWIDSFPCLLNMHLPI